MRLRFRNIIVFVVSVVMIVILPADTWAGELESGSETGEGEIEGNVKTDIYKVVLPTVANSAFDFIIDPQGLINKTNGAAYGGKMFEQNATLFFHRTDEKVMEDYCSTSDAVTITNMGSNAIEISVNIRISTESLGGIRLSDDKEFKNDTDASIYMALVDGKNTVPIGSQGISMDVVIDSAPEEAYEYKYDDVKDEYTYQLRENLSDIEFSSYSFQLTGAANEKGDWSQMIEVKPQITISWKIVSK